MNEIRKEFLSEIIKNQDYLSVFGDEFNGRNVAIISHPIECPNNESYYLIVVDSKYYIVGTTINNNTTPISSINKIKKLEALQHIDEYLEAHNRFIRDFWKNNHNSISQ